MVICPKLARQKTQAITFFKINAKKIIYQTVTQRSNCLKYLGFPSEKHLNFSFHITEVVMKLSKQSSVLSRLGHYFETPVLLQ